MSDAGTLHINIGESFERLPRAPIVEAVIDIRARATTDWNEASVRSKLEAKLKEYPLRDSQREAQIEMKVQPGKPPSQEYRDLGWKGLRVCTPDKKNVAQFNRDGFVFSRLQPYEDWQRLRSEALRLWGIFWEIARPVEVGRIGLRFINRIPISPNERNYQDYVSPAPQPPRDVGLVLRSFMHHDVLEVPGHPYVVRVVKTIQDVPGQGGGRCYLIFDIDVLTKEKVGFDGDVPSARLEEMRWLKNKVFFNSITDKALKEFGGGQK